MAEKEPKELTQEEQEAKMMADMYEYVAKTFGPSAPTEEKVTEWKSRHRRVRVLPLSDREIYFYRPIKRSEYKTLLNTAQTTGGDDPDNFLKEQIVHHCVLWPVMDSAQFNDAFGGTLDSLYSVIMEASNFLSQEALFTIVREL